MEKIDIGLPSCYETAHKVEKSDNLVITFTPTNGFFLYHNDLDAQKICIATKKPNYYLFNPGNACKKLANYIMSLGVKNIILIGSSKAGLASLIWGELLSRSLDKNIKIFALSFSPQTLVYPYNERLYFPSYRMLMNSIKNSEVMRRCAENYGDVNKVLANSNLKGMIIYPKLNPCDSAEAERVKIKNVQLLGLDYPLHGSFLPFMKQARDPVKLKTMVTKIYNNALKDDDISATIPESSNELYNIVSSIEVPTIEELCKSIFFSLSNQSGIRNFEKVKHLGFSI